MAEGLLLDHIYEGDCREVLAALPERSVDVVFADPPYNLQLRQELRRPDTSLVDAVDDEWDRFDDFAAYDAFTRAWLEGCRRVLREDGTLWAIGSYHNIFRIGAIMQDLGFWILNDVVWVKRNPMPNFRGARLANAHETLIWAARSRGQRRHTFNYHALKSLNDGKQLRSDWELPICTGAERLRVGGAKLHATQKPEALLHRVLSTSTRPGDVVLDPFFGTGTTGAVARRLGRRFVGVERDPEYIAAARARIDAVAPGDPAALAPAPTRRDARRVPFGELLERGMLRAGQALLFDGDPARPATVMADGTLLLPDGRRGSIHAAGALLLGAPSCNGWERWHYEDSGAAHPIDRLRELVREGDGAPGEGEST
jgi:modification methylase